MPTVEFEGQQYDFPEDASQEEMTAALSNLPKEEAEVVPEEPREPFAEEDTIKKDEGVRRDKEGAHVAYMDSKKKLTGGRGHLLTKEEKKLYPKGTMIPDDVVKEWFKTDMDEADKALTSVLEKRAVHVPDEVYNILLNMTFNLGEKGISKFDDMWKAIEVGDWQTAAAEMKDSDWFKDVKNRAVRLVDRMAAIQSNVQEETAANDMTPSKGGLFKDSETGQLFMVDEQGNKTEV
ncbi:MAG: glycoside hydrolase family protein [Nitrosomonadaceae bacterium]